MKESYVDTTNASRPDLANIRQRLVIRPEHHTRCKGIETDILHASRSSQSSPRRRQDRIRSLLRMMSSKHRKLREVGRQTRHRTATSSRIGRCRLLKMLEQRELLLLLQNIVKLACAVRTRA